MSNILNMSSKNSYLTSKQWEEVVKYVKNRSNIIEEDVVKKEPQAEEIKEVQHSEAYKRLIQMTSVSTMYTVLLTIMNDEPEKLYEITEDELQILYNTITQMNNENPSNDYIDLVDTLQYLAGDYSLNGASTYAITTNGTWQGSRIMSDTIQELGSNVVITLRMLTDSEITTRKQSANFVVPNGVTLTLKGYGTFCRDVDNTIALVCVENGGKLIIEGTSKSQPLIIDGKNTIAKHPLIVSYGEVEINNAIIQDGKNRSISDNGTPNGIGGGIRIYNTGSLTINNSIITRNTSSLNGGGIYCAGTMDINNSTLSYNRAMSSETGSVNAGRGGGFMLDGENAIGIIRNTICTENAAMYYGGAGQISGGCSLTMEEGSVFSNNQAVLHGAGALHVTGSATFTMDGGIIQNNTAQSVGGGIHSSYACVLNLNSGRIINNTANGRGGGIHINTGGAITLNSGIEISGNTANNSNTGSYAEVDETGDNWSNMKYEGVGDNNGYGGGILIDSGTCTVNGASIVNNTAAVDGGGIGLVMLNASSGGIEHLMVVNFNMISGVISGNTSSGNGAGVYLMSNKVKENIIKNFGEEGTEGYNNAVAKLPSESLLTDIPRVEVSGGIISENIAINNGGGLYLDENTKFVICDNGEISNNIAIDGGGVYIAQGEAVAQGGSISDNTASNNGGAIYIKGSFTMTNSTFSNNTSESSGGAVYITEGNVNIESGIIANNIALDKGGAIAVTSGNITIGAEECHNAGESSTHIHPAIENNIASDGGGIYVDGGVTTMWCGDIKQNLAHDKTVNVLVISGGNFVYNGGTIGIPYDSGVFVNGGVFEDKTEESETVLKHELHYHSVLGDETYNGKIPVSKWIASPRGDVINVVDSDPSSVTWADLYPVYEFVGWKGNAENDTDEVVNLYAIWEKKV